MHALHSSLRDRAQHLILAALIFAGTSMSADFARPANDMAAVHPLFDLSTPTGSPFPSDRFTVADPDQNTGRRVALPMPADCVANQSECEDLGVINTLDGFNMQPRLSIPFDGSIDINSVTNRTVFLISLGDALDPHDSGGQVVGINQVVWDTFTNTLHVESDELLNQHARYALIVTTGVRDESGEPVEASESFRRFRSQVRGEYKHELLDAIHAARRSGVGEDEIVTASVFTTQSSTAVLEQIRDEIKAGTPEWADFNLGPGGARTVFPRSQVTGITFNQQTRVEGSLNPVRLHVESLDMLGSVVGTIAFGKYRSPDYMVHPGEFIPPVGTRTGSPQVQGTNEIYFNLYLPSGARPAGGWPVAIVGHGRGGSKDFDGPVEFPWNIASTLAAHGIATIIINHAGHGFGPLGTLTVNETNGTSVTFSAGGRGIDQNRDGRIDDFEGAESAPPRILQGVRDGYLQTVADYMQLVRVIQIGMDVDGDGIRDLDSFRLYYVGWSQGSVDGVLFMAVEPDVRAAVFTAAGGPVVEDRRSVQSRPLVAGLLAARQPSLLNSPGITGIEGVAVPDGPFFNENIPLRDSVPYSVVLQNGTTQIIQSPVINTVTGAMAIQEWFDRAAWAAQASNPVAYAPHLRRRPLPSVSARPGVFQFAKGDQVNENPRTTAVLRAGDLADRATLYRHDLACAENPACRKPGHGFMVYTAGFGAISRGAQEQIATFFASDGTLVIHPEPARFFEVPISSPLPEDLGYIR